ncbi:auxilin-related protein 2-like [Ipomoea triloba]|uniref:auxilin-related protein 2-like n=1 Tax=Ipomoea triloba TaxID=35885 RepID=UPI00125D421A|nr:auxilin-related protein 2-like [Ipomoea triloba]
MDDLDVLARDFGLRPGGKSAPMRSGAGDRRPPSSSSPLFDDRDGALFSDVFGGPPKYTSSSSNSNRNASAMNDLDYDSIFKPGNDSKNNYDNNSSKTSSVPVYDKPVYDEDIFDGLPGVKSKSVSSTARFDDDVFASMTSPPSKNHSSNQFDDLLGNLGRSEKVAEPQSSKNSSSRAFDDLLAGFGSSSAASTNRPFTGSNKQPSKPSGSSSQTSSVMDDPFVVLGTSSAPASSPGVFSDPLEEITKLGKSGSAKADSSSVGGNVFDDLDPLNGFGKSVPPRDGPLMNESNVNSGKSSFRYSEMPVNGSQDTPLFDMPSAETQKSFSQTASPPNESSNHTETNSQVDSSPRSVEPEQPSEDIWLTVSEVPLCTQPTSAPPPSRPPPPIPRWTSKPEAGFFTSHGRRRADEYSSSPSYSQYSQSTKPAFSTAKSPPVSHLDELEEFAMGRTRNSVDGNGDVLSGEEMNANTAAAAMKEAVDMAEAKFRHAKEVRERENVKAARSKEAVQMEKDEQVMHEMQEREHRENQERLERERRQRDKEEEEREQRRLERERERVRLEREREVERERARQAVARATREARERAAVEAREKAAAEARMKAERAAVEKASAEARERAERAAVQRAQAEARERAAAAARERQNAETREREAREKSKTEAEARRRAERAAVERAAAEARERAAADAREKAAAAARMSQQRNDNDLESFFSTRASSVPRASSPETMFDTQFHNKGSSEGTKSTFSSGGVSSNNMRKVSSANNIVDDLSSIFGAASSAGEFQEVDGESEERRRARLERHQRTQERAAKALAEKNQRDLQVQRDQEERHRIAETLDFEIKRWAAGKEGNLRALLSTLQYVLWPECGWHPVSLTDLITGASVKKVYRKATLCIHPDKVQQKGANLQQKYIAEKVFDLLKEAWNKFNSEELF